VAHGPRNLARIALSVVLGVAAGTAALALGGARAENHASANRAGSIKPNPSLTPGQNQRPLSPEAKTALAGWASRLVTCLDADGLTLGQPETGETEIVIHLPDALAKDPMAFVPQMGRCTKALGGPPSATSVVFERGAIRLYKPKTCLLPKKPRE
jgi:hypothetical protein